MGWSDLIGRQLGQYTIVGELGRGGSSRVYRGTDQDEHQEVAIKVIFNDAEDRIGFVRRFEREVQAVAQLHHANIVEVYSHGETADLVYLVMQCISGGTLRQRCGRPVAVGEAAAAIVQMCMALQHAHENGIIHRDVKPSNMLLDAADPRYILLTDFGIAKLQGMLGLTKSGTTIGTPEYMSPEQAEGKDIDQRTDVYALGCVLYELLAGRPPFVGSTSVSVLYQQVHVRPPHLRAFNSEVPREVGRIVEQALAKRPEERFGTAAVLAEALYPYAEGNLPQLPGLQEYERRGVSGPLAQAFTSTGPLPPYALASLSPVISVSSTGTDSLSAPPKAAPQWSSSGTSPAGSGELVEPAAENWQGLGTEGLDAIFPDDPEAQPSHDARDTAISKTPTIEEMPSLGAVSESRPVPARSPNRSIPLPAFRLPSKSSQPLSGPVTESGRLDVEALMAQIEGQSAEPYPSEAGSDYLPPADPTSAAVGLLETPSRTYQDQDIPEHDTDEMAVLPPLPTGRRPSSSPRREEPTFQSRVRNELSSPRRRPLLLATAIAAVLCVLLVGGAIATASILGPGASSTGKTPVHAPTATAMVLPSPTETLPPRPSPTATTNPQQIVNQQAAAAFRSVILSPFADNSCSTGNASRHFNQGGTIYVDLCTSGGPFPGPVSVTIRQGGVVRYTMVAQLVPESRFQLLFLPLWATERHL